MQQFDRSNSGWRRRQGVGGLLLTLVTLLSVAIRWPALGEPQWIDELHTGWTVAGGLAELPQRAAAGNQSACYFYLPWLATRCFELNAWTLRLPSLVAGAALVPLAGWLVRRWTRSTSAAVVAALLVALDRNFVFYSVEARSYALVQLVGLLHVAALIEYVQRPSRAGRVVWLVSGIFIFYLHYTAALLVASGVLVRFAAIVWQRWASRTAPRPSTIGYTALGIDVAVWIAALVPAASHVAEIGARRDNWSTRLVPDALSTIFPWTECLLVPLAAVLATINYRRRKRRHPWFRPVRTADLPIVLACMTIPLAFAAMATELGDAQLQRYRYLIVSATMASLVAPLLVSVAGSRLLRLFAAAIVIVAALPLSELVVRVANRGTAGNVRHEDWTAAIQTIERSPERREWPVLLCPDLVEDGQLVVNAPDVEQVASTSIRAFCRFPLRAVRSLDRPDEQIIPLATHRGPRLSPADVARLTDAGGAWLLVRGNSRLAQHVSDELAKELADRGTTIRTQTEFRSGNLTLLAAFAESH